MSLTKYKAACGVCQTEMRFDAEDIPRLVVLDHRGRGPDTFCPLGHSQYFDVKIATQAVAWVREHYPFIAREAWDKPQPVRRRLARWRSKQPEPEPKPEKVEPPKDEPSEAERVAALAKKMAQIDDYLARRGEFAPEPAAGSIEAAIEEEVKKR